MNRGAWNSSCTRPAGRGHPLHVAGADAPAAARRVAVLDLALVDDRHRLEPAVRMLADAAPPLGRREFGRAGVVEQQERAQLGAVRWYENRLRTGNPSPTQ